MSKPFYHHAPELPKDVRLHVLVDEPMYNALRKLNAETGTTVGEIVRRMIQANLDAKEAPAAPRPVVFVPERETR